MKLRLSLSMLLIASTAATALGDQTSESFDDGLIDPQMFSITTPDGYEVALTAGHAEFTKNTGTGNGFARLTTVFSIKGDFVVTIKADRVDPAGNAEIGLASTHLAAASTSGGFTDVYFRGNGLVISNIFVDAVHVQQILADSSNPVTFRIRRIGNRLVHECDPGFGYVHVSEATHPALAGPVRLGLFLGQEDGQTIAHTATFDDLFVQGDVFSPACGDGALEAGEACDDDDPAWAPGQHCNASCTILACGDPDDTGTVTATDALFLLRTSVGAASCDACLCDVDGSGGVAATSATDARRVLQRAVGLPIELACPACG